MTKSETFVYLKFAKIAILPYHSEFILREMRVEKKNSTDPKVNFSFNLMYYTYIQTYQVP